MWKTHLRSHDTKGIFDCNIKLLEKYFDFPLGGGFHKAIYALRLKFEQIYPNLYHAFVLNSLCFLPDLGLLYALCPAPNFYEIYPSLNYI